MLRVFFTALLIAATCAVGIYLPHFKAMDYFAILLVLLAGLMVGFALSDGRSSRIIVELVVASGFIALTLLGMWKWAWLIPAGFVLFGVWCLIHYYTGLGARIRTWFAPLCAMYSILVAGFIYGRFFT